MDLSLSLVGGGGSEKVCGCGGAGILSSLLVLAVFLEV